MSKPRAAYTPMEDFAVMQEVMAHINGGGSGSGRTLVSKHEWAAISQREGLQDKKLTGEALRRRVGELVKKFKRDEENEAAGKERMRWGMAWPKSLEEQERDRLVRDYIKLQEDVKQKPQHPQPAKQQQQTLSSSNLNDIPTKKAPTLVASSTRRTSLVKTKPMDPPPPPPAFIVVENQVDDSFDAEYGYDNDSDPEPLENIPRTGENLERERLALKRRRLEMDERVQNRMLDIQAEQITLQREQLRFQAESLRAVADATQAIARALHAFPKRS